MKKRVAQHFRLRETRRFSPMTSPHDPSRRRFLKGVAAGAAGTMLSGNLCGVETPAHNAIRSENEKPGTRDWMLTNTRIDPATKYRCPWIEGYCSHTSI